MKSPFSFSYEVPKWVGWAYDPNGNVTVDPLNGVSIAWNVIGQPRTLTSGTSSTQRFYLADGTLSHAQDGNQLRIFLGDIVFKVASGGFGIESAGWEGGRLLPGTGNDKVLYYVNDHLGSVRTVKDGAGTVRQRYDYYPYGTVSRSWSSNSSSDTPDKRYRFGGKEIAGSLLSATATGSDKYLDFGARLYNPRSAMWLSQDPMAEKFYPIGLYVYCAGNPVNLVDPKGQNWYMFFNEFGEQEYIYIEGHLSDAEIEEKGYIDMGYSFFSNDNYYSLFGQVIPQSSSLQAQMYSNIDNLLITRFTSPFDSDGNYKKVSMYLDGYEAKEIGFVYKGKTFQSIKGVVRGSSNVGDGSIYYSVDENNAHCYITRLPEKMSLKPSFTRQFKGYWLTAANGKGAYEGFQVLQIKFDKTNAMHFIRSINNLFGE